MPKESLLSIKKKEEIKQIKNEIICKKLDALRWLLNDTYELGISFNEQRENNLTIDDEIDRHIIKNKIIEIIKHEL